MPVLTLGPLFHGQRLRSHSFRDFANISRNHLGTVSKPKELSCLKYFRYKPQIPGNSPTFASLGAAACCADDRQPECNNRFPNRRTENVID
jgi:hypothetical protein